MARGGGRRAIGPLCVWLLPRTVVRTEMIVPRSPLTVTQTRSTTGKLLFYDGEDYTNTHAEQKLMEKRSITKTAVKPHDLHISSSLLSLANNMEC